MTHDCYGEQFFKIVPKTMIDKLTDNKIEKRAPTMRFHWQ